MAYHKGVYDDAISVKRNTFVLFLVNLFGGLAPGATRHMYVLAERARRLDRTQYPPRGATKYLPYWTQLLSAAIVTPSAGRGESQDHVLGVSLGVPAAVWSVPLPARTYLPAASGCSGGDVRHAR